LDLARIDGFSVDDDSSGQSLGDGDGGRIGRHRDYDQAEKQGPVRNLRPARARLELFQPEVIVMSPEAPFPPIPPGETASGQAPFVVRFPAVILSRPLSFWLKVEGPQGLALSDYVTIFVSR
jgi:hypothetical protein